MFTNSWLAKPSVTSGGDRLAVSLENGSLSTFFGDDRGLQRRACAGDDFCFGRGRLNVDNCSCTCNTPFIGRMCSIIGEDAGDMNCTQRKAVGPSGPLSYSSLVGRVQDTLNSFEAVLGIVNFLLLVGMVCCCLSTSLARAPVHSFPSEQDVVWTSCGVLILSLILVCFWNASSILVEWALFPYNVIFSQGQWPHADRAILFCVGDVGFEPFIFILQASWVGWLYPHQ